MNPIYLTGFADEAGAALDTQIKATKELGWSNIEMRNVQIGDFPAANLHDIPDDAFEAVVEKLAAESITINSFGSAIANGAKNIEDPFEITLAEARRAIPRMQRLGTKLIRIMSYPIRKEGDDQMEEERFRRLRELQQMFGGAGLIGHGHRLAMDIADQGESALQHLLVGIALQQPRGSGQPVAAAFQQSREASLQPPGLLIDLQLSPLQPSQFGGAAGL